MEHESHHHHHPHKTGVRWLDLGLGLHSAHSMEKLVAANSYPYVEVMRSTSLEKENRDAEGFNRRVKYMFENNGVGPARIEWVELKFKGEPVHNLKELLEKCCAFASLPGQLSGLDSRGGIAGSLIRPGAMVHMFTWAEPRTANPIFDALHKQMDDIDISACYCSVFDECYVSDNGDDSKPRSVEQCTPPKVSFRPNFGNT